MRISMCFSNASFFFIAVTNIYALAFVNWMILENNSCEIYLGKARIFTGMKIVDKQHQKKTQ